MKSTESLIKSIGESPMPPVEQWDPDYCGEMDIVLKADGSWIYGGTPFTRRKMQLLFSRVIKKENEQYFLVTPVEKLGIQVEYLPFVIIDFELVEHDAKPTYRFIDNCDNQVLLTEQSQWQLGKFQGQMLPSVCIRRNLFASFNRACYYRLVEEASIKQSNDVHQVVIQSNGIEFNLGSVEPEE
ncbi:MAG: DUF1285 domain-containing protein [Kangiellaceae bacterium]|nr:DUF1285 domain-containing protein [Kangiellaceae bacterium]MCW8999619.1 DUF1285 domain-containing protein [Kangiellaceae bacterium]